MKKVVFKDKDFPFKKRKWVPFVFTNNNEIVPLQPIPTSASPTPRISNKCSASPQPTSIRGEEISFKKRKANMLEVIDISDDDSVAPVPPTQVLGTIHKKKWSREENAVVVVVLFMVVDVDTYADQALQVSWPMQFRPHKEIGVG